MNAEQLAQNDWDFLLSMKSSQRSGILDSDAMNVDKETPCCYATPGGNGPRGPRGNALKIVTKQRGKGQ